MVYCVGVESFVESAWKWCNDWFLEYDVGKGNGADFYASCLLSFSICEIMTSLNVWCKHPLFWNLAIDDLSHWNHGL